MQELHKCGYCGYKVVFRIISRSGAAGSSLGSWPKGHSFESNLRNNSWSCRIVSPFDVAYGDKGRIWKDGRRGVCAGLKIRLRWFDFISFHKTYTVWFNSHRYAEMGYRRLGEYRYIVRLAQLVEQYTVNVKVGSSILSPGAMKRR